MMKRLALILLLSTSVLGQSTRPTSAPVASKITRPESIQDSGLYDYWTQMSGQGRVGGALLGKLRVEGEPLPWEPVLITVTCSGELAYSTATDAKGDFAIDKLKLPGAQGLQGDSQRQMETHFEGCLVQGVASGFRSNTITITQHNLRDDPEIGTITLSRVAKDAATTLSATTETASPKAIRSFEKARGQMLEHRPEAAERELQKAVQIDPSFAEAWFQLGKLQEPSDPKAARESFAKGIAADPKFILPYERLATLAAQGGDWKEVIAKTNQLEQVYPTGTAQSWYLNALANYQMGKADAAEASARKSLALDPRHTILNTEQLLAVVLAAKGEFKQALEHLRSSLTYMPAGANADLLKQQIAQLEKRVASN